MPNNPPQFPPANWYPDPERGDMSRYWDGAQWTDARRPAQAPAVAPPPPVAPDAARLTRPAQTATLLEERPQTASRPGPEPVPHGTKKNGLGRTAMWLALAALVLGAIPFVGFLSWIIAVVAIILAVAALQRKLLSRKAAVAALVIAPIAVISGFTTAVNAVTGHPSTAPAAEKVAAVVPSASAPATASATSPATGTTSAPAAVEAAAPPAEAKSALPASEQRFISIVKTAADKIESTSSSLKEAKYRSARDASACAVLTDNEANKWVGTVTDIGANGDGYGYISIKIAEGITVQTWNNAFSDIGDDTLVKPSKPFFDRMTNLEEGDTVYFAGRFLGSDTSCLRGANITKTFYGLTPEFLMRFSNIRKK